MHRLRPAGRVKGSNLYLRRVGRKSSLFLHKPTELSNCIVPLKWLSCLDMQPRKCTLCTAPPNRLPVSKLAHPEISLDFPRLTILRIFDGAFTPD